MINISSNFLFFIGCGLSFLIGIMLMAIATRIGMKKAQAWDKLYEKTKSLPKNVFASGFCTTMDNIFKEC